MHSNAHRGGLLRATGLPILGALVILLVTSAGAAENPDAKTRSAARGADSAAAATPAVVDVNAATVEELMSVKGIGASLAQRIVEFREKNGPYKSVEDLLKVQGIGEKSLERLRDHLTVGKSRGR